MKLTLIAAALASAFLAADAATYVSVFKTSQQASDCLVSNAAYIHKVSTSSSASGRKLILNTSADCDMVILTEVSEVCGNVARSCCEN